MRIFFSTIGLLLVAIYSVASLSLSAQERDTTVVQAFTFADDPTLHAWGNIYEYDGVVDFPEPGGRYEKIVMRYTLKCDSRTKADNLGCGEWDYSTFTRVWDDSVSHWEIGRFITPYGIGLDLGAEGFTWEFDVSDYAPILNGTKRITAGNSQELLDLTFLFISGIPARDPISVTRLWTPGNKNYQQVVDDSILSAIDVTLDPDATMYRINTRPQGGNFNGGANTDNCAEFCDRQHILRIDGEERFRWNVWKECGENPVFPQGGTWLHDRAGWCPGAIVETQHHELTPFVTPGQTVSIDYDIENPPQFVPYGHWVFWADLVAYGPPNFAVDAGIESVVAPSGNGLYSRINPWCGGPIVDVVNRGSEEITEITFAWQFGEGEEMTWTWNGSLPFLGSETIELPPIDPGEWVGDIGELRIEIRKVNDGEDEYSPNNIATSPVEMPERLPSAITLNLLTNRLAEVSTSNYELTLYDGEGNVVLNRKDFGVSERTKIPLELPDGCYRLELINPEGFGLDFWAIRDQLGTGTFQIDNVDGETLKTFGGDFGNSLIYSFRVPAPTIEFDQTEVDFGSGKVGEPIRRVLRLTPANSIGIEVKRAVFLSGGGNFKIAEIDPPINDGMAILYGDTMTISIDFTPSAEKSYSGRMLVTSNDTRGVIEILTSGKGDNSITSVVQETLRGTVELRLRVVDGVVRWSAFSEDRTVPFSPERIQILDSRGRVVYSSDLVPGSCCSGEVDIESLSSGVYSVRLDGKRGVLDGIFTHVR